MFRNQVCTRQTEAAVTQVASDHRARICPRSGSTIAAILAIVCGALLAVPAALAVPASPEPFPLKQPDGTTVTARHGGDEKFGWISVAGRLVERGSDGFWRYMLGADGQVRLSGAKVGLDPAPAGAATVSNVPALALAALPAAPAAPRATTWGPVALNPTEPLLVILVEFSGTSMKYSEDQWSSVFFSTTGKTVRTYYDEASRRTFHFTPAGETGGTVNNGVVKVSLPYAHPNTGRGSSEQVVKDALVAADPYVNFASFKLDTDNGLNTHELHIVTIWAGYEMSADPTLTPHVWAHRGDLGYTVAAPVLDGVTVGDASFGGGYVAEGEVEVSYMATIGGPCHELGHDLGLPDLYDYTGASEGVGIHCLMAGGSWGAAQGEPGGTTPTLLCAWSRSYLSFLTPTIPSGAGTQTLVEASDPVNSNVVKILTSDPNQYFLLENRQLTGFDAGMYDEFNRSSGGATGGGIAIWHVDESRFSWPSGNNNYAHKHVDLEEADEGALGYSELDTAVNRGNRLQYYYAGNVTAFDDTTTPNSKLYNGTASGVSVSNVSASGATMTLNLGQGSSTYVLISGHVRTGTGMAVIGATLSGLPGNPVTDSSGYYSAIVSLGWSGTVTPSKNGSAFLPMSRTYSNQTVTLASEDYTAVSGTCTISGRITLGTGGLGGVNLVGLPGSPSTNITGDYSATVSYGWSGSVTPSKPGYMFSPANHSYSNVTMNVAGEDYLASPQIVTISGRVTRSDGSAVAGAAISGLPGSPSTDNNGYYTATVNHGWYGTITPIKTGYTFTPPSRNCNGAIYNLPGQNYTAQPENVLISGWVTEADGAVATGVAMTGLPGTPVTNSHGYYSVRVSYDWSGTVSPTKAGRAFTPFSRSYVSATYGLTSENYVGVLQRFTIAGRITADGVGLAGVKLSGLPGAPTTDSSGSYSATVEYGWSGTASPTKAGYNLSPSDRSYNNVAASSTSENYTAALPKFTISGRIMAGGKGLAGVTLGGLPGSPTTGSDGSYSVMVSDGWSGTVTPSKAGYTFDPSSCTYSNAVADAATDYAAQASTDSDPVNPTSAVCPIAGFTPLVLSLGLLPLLLRSRGRRE